MAKPERPPEPTSDVPRLPPRNDNMHKGQAGRVAIIAGSRGMSGAACLAALGALRGGAGLVRVFTPASVQPIVAASEPCLMTEPLDEDPHGRLSAASLPALQGSLAWSDVAAVGPGLDQAEQVREVVQALIDEFKGPVVLDADGLNNLAPVSVWWHSRANRDTVITPHPGEIARLREGAGLTPSSGRDDESRLRSAFEFARLTGTTVVLKGHRSVVCTPTTAYVNTTGNPGMATGGMGDVLTGLIAALLGQGLSAFDAARLGVHCHGAAADRLARQIGPFGYLAREVADALPAVLGEFSRPKLGFK